MTYYCSSPSTNGPFSVSAVYETHSGMPAVVSVRRGRLTFHHYDTRAGAYAREAAAFAQTPCAGAVSAVCEDARSSTTFFFVGADRRLHRYYRAYGDAEWEHDGASFTSAGVVTGAVAGVYEEAAGRASVYAQGGDHHLHYFGPAADDDDGWTHEASALRAAGEVGGAVAAVYEQQLGHSSVFFHGADGRLHYVYREKDGHWAHETDAFDAARPLWGPVAALYDPARGHATAFCKNSQGLLHYFFWENGGWRHDGTSFAAAGEVSDCIAAVWDQQAGHAAVACCGSDGRVHYFAAGAGTQQWAHRAAQHAFPKAVHCNIDLIFDKARAHAELVCPAAGNGLTCYDAGPQWTAVDMA